MGYQPLIDAKQLTPEVFVPSNPASESNGIPFNAPYYSTVGTSRFTEPTTKRYMTLSLRTVRSTTNNTDTVYYVSSATIPVLEGWGQNFMAVIFVPEVNLLSKFGDVRNIVVGITAAVMALITALFSLSARLIFRPLQRLARLMRHGAYLADGGAHREGAQAAVDAAAELRAMQNDRTPSRLAEVRALQEAYWAMSDELQLLKGYIPEHIREEVLGRARRGGSDTSSTAGGSFAPSNPRTMVAADVAWSAADGIGTGDYTSFALAEFSETEDDPTGAGYEAENAKHTDDPDKPSGNSDTPTTENNNTIDLTDENAKNGAALPPPNCHQPLTVGTVYFVDPCLVDRHVTLVHLNTLKFHTYALRTHPQRIGTECAALLTFVRTEVKRFGGVLESFNGDKLWVSFNATSKCDHHQVSAAYFAFHVTEVVNRHAVAWMESTADWTMHNPLTRGA